MAWQFRLMQSNRALLIEEPSMLAVGRKREGKDYEITEHTAGFVLSEYASWEWSDSCKNRNLSKLAYSISSKYRRQASLENKLHNPKMFFKKSAASGTVANHREGLTCKGQNKQVL